MTSATDEAQPGLAAAAVVIAQQAGTDTWKTWAGRKDGEDDFQFGDLWNGVAAGWRHMIRRRKGDKRGAGKTCPICDDGDPEPDAEGKKWLRLYCGCTVCSGCVRNWNLTLLNDGNGGTGVPTPPKLKCPVCAAPLRKTDAVEVLRRIPSVTLKWDELTRDALLRSMPDFRSCPTCQGGGFTTPECLAPRHTAMVDSAIDVVAQYRLAVLVVYGGFAIGLLRAAPPTYVAAFALTVGIGGRVLARWAALAATRIVTSPLTVECPECSGEYLLQGYGEALSGERDTDQWIHEHTRPCPACGSPIQKAGGCNAMVCGACGSPFCWSCMRAKSACTHFDCANGSPFADKQTTGGRNGQPLTINTPAAHTAALIELANTYGGLALMIAVGAISSAMSNEPSFSTVQWLWKVAVELLIIGAWGLLYLVAAAGIGVIAMVGYRAYGSRPRRGWRGWGR